MLRNINCAKFLQAINTCRRLTTIPEHYPCRYKQSGHPSHPIQHLLLDDTVKLSIKNHRIQYFSDVHVDKYRVGTFPKFEKDGDILVICGDIGVPTHLNFGLFCSAVSNSYEKVFLIPGNHEYNCGVLFQEEKYNDYRDYISRAVDANSNFFVLDNKVARLDDRTIIAGSTLWTKPIATQEYMHMVDPNGDHVKRHERDVKWLESTIKKHCDDTIIIATHMAPLLSLIDPKYKNKYGSKISWFATDLQHLIFSPVVAWLYGHSHQISREFVNGVFCAANAHGYNNLKNIRSESLKIFY